MSYKPPCNAFSQTKYHIRSKRPLPEAQRYSNSPQAHQRGEVEQRSLHQSFTPVATATEESPEPEPQPAPARGGGGLLSTATAAVNQEIQKNEAQRWEQVKGNVGV